MISFQNLNILVLLELYRVKFEANSKWSDLPVQVVYVNQGLVVQASDAKLQTENSLTITLPVSFSVCQCEQILAWHQRQWFF